MKDATSVEVGKFIYEDILTRFGCPVEILTDSGANFFQRGWKDIFWSSEN